MAAHSSIPAWEIPWTVEPGGLQSMGSQSQTRQHHHHHHGYILALFRTFPGNRDFRKILEKDWGKKQKTDFF